MEARDPLVISQHENERNREMKFDLIVVTAANRAQKVLPLPLCGASERETFLRVSPHMTTADRTPMASRTQAARNRSEPVSKYAILAS